MDNIKNIFKQKPWIKKLCIAFAAVFCLVFVYDCIKKLYWMANPIERWNYPEIGRIYKLDRGIDDLTLEDMGMVSQYAVIGIVEESKNVGKKYGGSHIQLKKVTFNVKNIIKGKLKRGTITIWIDKDIAENAPQFKEGDKMLLMLNDNVRPAFKDEEKSYEISCIYSGYFYVLPDGRICPARRTAALKPVEKMSLNEVKYRIRYGANMSCAVDKENRRMLRRLYPYYKFDWDEYRSYWN